MLHGKYFDEIISYYTLSNNWEIEEYFILNNLISIDNIMSSGYLRDKMKKWDNVKIFEKCYTYKKIGLGIIIDYIINNCSRIVEYIFTNKEYSNDEIINYLKNHECRDISREMWEILLKYLTFDYSLLIYYMLESNTNIDYFCMNWSKIKISGGDIGNALIENGLHDICKFEHFRRVFQRFEFVLSPILRGIPANTSMLSINDIKAIINVDMYHLSRNPEVEKYIDFFYSLRLKYNI